MDTCQGNSSDGELSSRRLSFLVSEWLGFSVDKSYCTKLAGQMGFKTIWVNRNVNGVHRQIRVIISGQ